MKFAVTIISPPGYAHSEAFREVSETIHEALVALGHDAILTTETNLPGRRHIILGANLLPRYPQALKSDSILYNLEQVEIGSTWFQPELLDLFKRHSVWDYSESNIATLKTLGIDAIYVPIGYMPGLTRIPECERDIDILFFGSVNERRKRVLDDRQLRDDRYGFRIKIVNGVYGAERDALIARSKIVLNLHFYESKIFEIVRVSYLLANRVFVVSESGSDRSEDYFATGLAFSSYENLAATCIDFFKQDNVERRRQIAEAGYELMVARDEREILEAALTATITPTATLERYFQESAHRPISKWAHYFDIYERHFARFRNKPVRVLEFGVWQGGSLQMWRDYFGAQAEIIGVDIDPGCKRYEEDGFRIYIGDQEDRTFLKTLRDEIGSVDIVIEDGGHHMGQQIATFEEIYPMVASDGVFLMEDLATSYWQEFGGGHRRPGTFVEYAKDLMDQLNAWYSREPDFVATDFTRSTKAMHVYNMVVVFEKGLINAPQMVVR